MLKDAWANYRDESFIQQFLGPKVMRRFHMFALEDNGESPYVEVTSIHNQAGFHGIRDGLARSYDISTAEPEIHVADVDLLGDRKLQLHHICRDEVPLDAAAKEAVLVHMRRLWGYEVTLHSVGPARKH